MGAALSITIDVDGIAGLPDGGAGYAHRLTPCSERTYGIVAGLPRILRLLDEFDVTASFYVPGVTARRHPDELGALAASHHEIAHHGHTHRFPHTLDAAAQRAEIADGCAALTALTGRTPRGYRAPGWELTATTLELIAERGFAWDSSLMGDDGPYAIAGRRLIELPVHWALDDAPHFVHTTDPAGLTSVWLAELAVAQRERRPLTVTLHPEILGRPHRLDVLRWLLDAATLDEVPIVTHGELAAAVAGTP
jgi:peptidoglycan/xylan/chitin deacetylase (PgdA/CDA1 family)